MLARQPSLRAFLGATTGWIRRIPGSLAGSVVATALVCAVLFAVIVGLTLAVLAATTVFAGLYGAPAAAVMAFQPYAHSGVAVDITEAAQARRDILSDPQNPLRCVASADMRSTALPLMVMHEGGQPPSATAPAVVDGQPIQITDNTAALLPEIEAVIATIPRGAVFYETYAFVLTAVNGGVDSWQRFVSITTQLRLGTPADQGAALGTASVFFAPGSDLTPTHALAAAVMLRLSAIRVVSDEQEAGRLLEQAVNACV
ncbi:hypothetical protein ACNUDN_30205 [Mycobacterium sp. smrl_JER01]|uniref:hypothetical protein n=1 Tax=Mycobacterium sp. smrl_JER01 TaxID=3402633 RepID=UPI003AD00D5F